MKKLFSIILAMCVSVTAFTQSNLTNINDALKQAAAQFSESLKANTTVAILGISSSSADLSEYMLDELTTNVVQTRKLQVVTRANLDVIKKEMNFQLSGEVSDETMQRLGAKTGAQTVISGTFKQLGTAYRINIQAFDVTTAVVQDVYQANVSDDDTLALLTKKKVVDSSGKVTKNAYDYTAGERVGMGFQNMLFGLGSYTHGHWGDGLFMTAVEGLGVVFIFLELTDEGEDRYDAEGRYTGTDFSYEGFSNLGLGLIAASWLYGFIRPCFYHKNTKIGLDGKSDGLNFAFVPTNKNVATQVSYRISW